MKKGIVALLIGLAVLILVSPGLIGRLADRSAEKGTRAYQRLLGVLGVLAIAVGVVVWKVKKFLGRRRKPRGEGAKKEA